MKELRINDSVKKHEILKSWLEGKYKNILNQIIFLNDTHKNLINKNN